LPIGRTVANSRALILSEDGKEVSDGATGVLCLEGACLALGYYGNDEKTQASFVQNPLNKSYPERIYYTGDLVYRNSDGEIIYVSRKDFQIKHMGYRIELGEIENAGNTVAGIKDCVCTYNTRRQKIIFYYEGEQMDKKHILDELTKKIPQYMLPGKIVYMESLPHNANGKIDRKSLEN
jgi:acyl-coenzyme A synthetase/AMP-(fatty) acid ligase